MVIKAVVTAKAANWQGHSAQGFTHGAIGRLRYCRNCPWKSHLATGFHRCPNCNAEFD